MQMKEKMEKVIDQKNIESFEWKLKPKYVGDEVIQNSVRLIDCSIDQLEGFIKHCENMLYNPKPWKPGRVVLYDNIPICIKLANTELCRRHLLKTLNTVDFKLIDVLNKFLNEHDFSEIQEMFPDIPNEFRGLYITDIISACLDKLGTFNKKPITLTFILEQGVWLNAEDSMRIKGKNKVKKIKNELGIKIKYDTDLEIKPEGLLLDEMKALINIKRTHKYRDMSDTQLILLRDKILFILRDKIRNQIKGWDSRIENIQKVIEYKKQEG